MSLGILLKRLHRVGLHGMVRGEHLSDVYQIHHPDVTGGADGSLAIYSVQEDKAFIAGIATSIG
ncbi:hypothetical protein EGJ22_06365 [Pseudomonas sp. p99-361]|nr:hypothetical protein A3K88_07570 [Pseudomonas putida]PPB16766.1 hypothetical protein HV87_19745 [Pseudomonas aeruginosa]RRV21354.1 hypothetical protein EGJ22_06365 [Pseudomonas sp. p99-361]